MEIEMGMGLKVMMNIVAVWTEEANWQQKMM
jgi:hypothetical protein